MRAGKLDRRVTILRATVTTDDFGGETATWADLATVAAEKLPVRDAERVAAAQTGASVTDRFRIRWSQAVSGLTTRDQLSCDGRLYDIVAIKEIGRREGLEITATAKAD